MQAEGSGLLFQLGIDWRLFLSQAFNFFILLLVLRFFVYKPLLSIIKERKKKIQEGLQKAEEADVRLQEVDSIAKAHLHKADQESIAMLKQTQERARLLEDEMLQKTEVHRQALMAKAEEQYKRQQEEARQKVLQESVALVKQMIVKTVELKPEAVDEALIKKAAESMKHTT